MALVVVSTSVPRVAAAALDVELTPAGWLTNVVRVAAATLVARPVTVHCAEVVPVMGPVLNAEADTVEAAEVASTRFVELVTDATVYQVAPSVEIW
jgi:hypothetical protein